jgi:tRNA (cmo5U34)-methyltransferase
MTQQNSVTYDAMFSGVIGRDYEMLKLICPLAVEMSRLVGEQTGVWAGAGAGDFQVLELGGGTGITTLFLLTAASNIHVLSVDNEPAMQDQAKRNLAEWVERGRLSFSGDDALTALRALPAASVDALASAYTLHNFPADYRREALQEIYRVLKPGGYFVNGDRYAWDDVVAHTRNTQHEIAEYFRVLIGMNRLDLLEHWIIHLFNDESEHHIMREAVARNQMREAGFQHIALSQRQGVNALVTAVK